MISLTTAILTPILRPKKALIETPPIYPRISFQIDKFHFIAQAVFLQGNAKYDIDVKGTAEQILYNLKKRKGYNPNVSSQHDEAAILSDSRYNKLKDLKIPVLIMHGINDPWSLHV